ncbi:MAG: RNA-directed DNA polymerase [Lachnospiraceae bacterium]|nr:RNA-directed DNA polymerase [Lachnospiraceae bacterium]
MIKLDEIFEFENTLDSYFQVIKGKRNHLNVIRYEERRLSNLSDLQERVLDYSYRPGKDVRFLVYEPKKREIVSNDFEDKIVQDVICTQALGPVISKKLIYDNYASQPGKGTGMALDRLNYFLHSYYCANQSNEGYILQCDIRKYFDHIQIPIVANLIDDLPFDNHLKDLLGLEIRSTNPDGIGICIGHQCSQWTAIYFLNRLDHFIKEVLKIKYYGRYMDDFYLIHPNKRYLQYCLEEISNMLEAIGLELNQKTQIMPLRNGIKVLGFHTYLGETGKVTMEIKSESKKRILKRFGKYKALVEAGALSMEEVIYAYNSWKSYAVYGNTEGILYAIDRRFYDLFKPNLIEAGIDFSEYCFIPGRYQKGGTIKPRDIAWAKERYGLTDVQKYEAALFKQQLLVV